MSFYQDVKRVFSRMIDNVGFWSTIPAQRMDEIYLQEYQGFLQNAWAFLRLRALSLVFIALSVIDMVVDLVMVMRYALGSLFRGETVQDARLAAQKKYATGFGNRFYALLATVGTLGLVWLISPKMIIFYFTTGKTNQTGVHAGGDYYHSEEAERVQPANDENELERLVQQAMQEGRPIIPMGAGLSQGKQFLPESNGKKPLIVDMKRFDTVTIDADNKTATVGAGAIWGNIQLRANEAQLALKVMQASNVFSVGGSLGTNIHGWDHKTGVLAETIEKIWFINAEGKKQEITIHADTTEADRTLFNHIIGGLGLYGMVYRVKLKLQTNEKLQRFGEEVPINDYATYFKEKMLQENVKMHYYRLDLNPDAPLKRGFTETYMTTDNKPCTTPNLSLEYAHGTRLQQILINLVRRSDGLRKFYWESERRNNLENNPVLTTNEVMQPAINAMFNAALSETEWLQEYFIPGDNLASFLENLSEIIKENQVPLLNASVRFVKQYDKSPLSYTANGDRFAVVICFNQSLQASKVIEAKKWLRKAQHLAVEQGGSYYLPYQHVSSPEDFDRSFPGAKAAEAYKMQIDPQQHFTSGFYQKYMARLSENAPKQEIDYVRRVMGRPEWREAFKGFLTHVLQRVDSDAFYALLDDVLTYNDTRAEVYEELGKRLPEIMPGPLSDQSHQLQSLHAIQTDLGAQASTLVPRGKTINGLVEVGSPARYVSGFKRNYKVDGTIYAVTESNPALVDRLINSGSLQPFDQHIPFDYNAPQLKGIPDGSVDVVTCYVGLHHFTPEGLDHFLKETKRVLRAGGQFLLVDHAVGDQDSMTMAMAHFAHFTFNAINGVSLDDELHEIRDFRPLSYWQAKLKEHGLDNVDVNDALIREGDPTKNCMVTAFNGKPVLQANIAAHAERVSNERAQAVNASELSLPKVAEHRYGLFSSNESSSDEGVEMTHINTSRPNNGK